ncbi:MAG: cyclic nucleotide-binding domain-containing protein [Myxococcota bacterium]
MASEDDKIEYEHVPVALGEVGIEETSHGVEDLTDTVAERPHSPTLEMPQLGRGGRVHDEHFILEEEHLFGDSPLFEGLDPEEIREIVNAAEKMPLQAGDVLFKQGTAAEALYIVQSGEIQVRAVSGGGEDVVLAVLGSSTAVGELALLDGGERSATVEALSDCDVYRLSRAAFNQLRDAQSSAAYKVILRIAAMVDGRRRQTQARINEVFEDPEQHIELFSSQVHDMLARLRKV